VDTSGLVSTQFKDEFITFEETKAQQYTVPSKQETRFSVHEERDDTLRKTTTSNSPKNTTYNLSSSQQKKVKKVIGRHESVNVSDEPVYLL